MTDEYKKTLCDIDLILNEIEEEEKNKIPIKLRNIIHENKLEGYEPKINKKIPLEDQQLTEETEAFLAMLYLNYWYKDEEDKNELMHTLRENEKRHQEELSEKYNPDNIFKNKESDDYSKDDEIDDSKQKKGLIPYKESIIKRILNKIFKFFRRR